jgi:hypothetical protein
MIGFVNEMNDIVDDFIATVLHTETVHTRSPGPSPSPDWSDFEELELSEVQQFRSSFTAGNVS